MSKPNRATRQALQLIDALDILVRNTMDGVYFGTITMPINRHVNHEDQLAQLNRLMKELADHVGLKPIQFNGSERDYDSEIPLIGEKRYVTHARIPEPPLEYLETLREAAQTHGVSQGYNKQFIAFHRIQKNAPTIMAELISDALQLDITTEADQSMSVEIPIPTGSSAHAHAIERALKTLSKQAGISDMTCEAHTSYVKVRSNDLVNDFVQMQDELKTTHGQREFNQALYRADKTIATAIAAAFADDAAIAR